MHDRRACRHESWQPHSGHVSCVDIRFYRTSVVGSEWRANLHRNTLTFEGTESFHSEDQDFSSWQSFDEPLLPSNHSSLCNFVLSKNLYAELTVNFPFLSGYQAQKSSMFRVHTGIFKIALASIGRNTDRTNASFHVAVAGDSSSETIFGGSATSEVIGLGNVSFGIQLSVQIFVVCPLPILRMIPC